MSIEVSGVGVDLPVYSSSARSLRRTLAKATVGGALFARPDNRVVVRALDNVSFKVEEGERIGIIGGNGAGKTTLLKVLSGVITPTRGVVAVDGVISSALEVSLGLDPEVSGYENIFLMGFYRGYSRRYILRHIDSIIETADLGSFINLPINAYSAGMQGRLTFATATAFEPDVLLMDEWLMAGDAAFMEGAFARATQFLDKARILVLATHSLELVKMFCTRAIYLRAGQIAASGDVDSVVAAYQAYVHGEA